MLNTPTAYFTSFPVPPARKRKSAFGFLLTLAFLLAASLLPVLAQVSFTNFEDARLVLGQPNFTAQNSLVDEVHTPGATALAVSGSGAVAVASGSAGRVLIWRTMPVTNGQPADVVVGKPNFTTTAYTTPTAASMLNCEGVAFSPDGRKLIVSDAANNRVLIWNSIPTTNGQPADVVIGQTNFTENSAGSSASKLYFPAGVFVTPQGKLIVTEVLNNRVLIFNRIPTTNGAAADVIVGQNGINSNLAGNAANQLNNPWYSTVSPDGKLLVSDSRNHRILIFNQLPATNGASADVVLGQSGFNVVPSAGTSASKFNFPLGLHVSNSGRLALADFRNNRVLVYNQLPTTSGAAADVVLGQASFTESAEHSGGVSARSMAAPTGVRFDFNGRLFVSERKTQGTQPPGRVLVFGNLTGPQADLVISSGASMALPCQEITLQYRVNIFNNGPSTATNVVAGVVIPAELTLASNAPTVSAGTYNASNGTWTFSTLAPGQSASLTFNGTVSGSFSGRVIRQFAVIQSSGLVDPNLANNVSGNELTVIGSRPEAPQVNSVTVCTNNDTTLVANGSGTIRWYNAAENGTLLFTGNTFATPNLTATTTYYAENYNGCIASVRAPVTVTVNQPLSNNLIAGEQTVCQFAPLTTFTGSVPAGGNGAYQYQWQISADNVTWNDFNSPAGRQKDFNPGGLGQTSFFRRRVIAGPCSHSFSNVIRVTVNPLPAVSFTGLPASICVDAAAITLTGSPAGGTFSGPGISGSTFDPAQAGTGGIVISYTFTNNNGCTNTFRRFVLVGPAVYAGGDQTVCVSAAPFALQGALPAGGTFSGRGVSNNQFDPAAAGPGDHVITYSLTGNFGCGTDPQTKTATRLIRVNPLPILNVGPALTVCVDAANFYLSGYSPTGGSWSGPGVSSDGFFRPQVAGVGTHTLVYSYNSGCLNTASKTVTVAPLPTVTLAPISNKCSSTFVPVALTGGAPAGGTYSGPGVSNNRFNPSTAGVGTHTITYTYQDANGCTASASQPVVVEICTGVAEDEILKTLAVYPIPAQEQLTVSFRMPKVGLLTVRLLNTAGQTVLQEKNHRVSGQYEKVFNTNQLPRGIYMLQLITTDAVVSKRVVLQ